MWGMSLRLITALCAGRAGQRGRSYRWWVLSRNASMPLQQSSSSRVRRTAPSRRSRPARPHQRARARPQPSRRRDHSSRRASGRRPYVRGRQQPRLDISRSLTRAVVAGSAVTALVLAVLLLAGNVSLLRWLQVGNRTVAVPTGATGPVAEQLAYTVRTANDAAITLPGAVQEQLIRAGQ